MADSEDQLPEVAASPPETPRRRRWRRVAAIVGLVLAALLAAVWFSRERIADNIIASELARMHLPATYRIARIGGTRQVLADIVIGDPQRPDLTIERAEVTIGYTIGYPKILGVKLVRPRLYGTYHGGKLSFGTLDQVLFKPSTTKEPSRLPNLDLTLEDGRAQLLTDYGPVGFKADGKGNLRSGFAGQLAAIAPQLDLPACAVRGASAYGSIKVAAERPAFSGPLRMATLRCPSQGLSLDDAAVQLDANASSDFKDLAGEAKLRSKRVVLAGAQANSLALDGRATWKDGTLNGRLSGDAGGVQAGGVAMALLGLDAQVRAVEGFGKLEVRGSLDGSGVAQGPALDRNLSAVQQQLSQTMLGPMVAQTRLALQRERGGSRLTADFTWRQTGSLYTLVVPSGLLRSGSGAALLSLSRFQVTGGRAGSAPLVSGNFSTGGPGLPQIAGRMERGPQGQALLRMTMAPYRAGGGALAFPDLVVAQGLDGAVGFAGRAEVSGALPGGYAKNLVLPLDGRLAANGELAVFRRCVTPTFDELAISSLVLQRRSITLCPGPSGAIVRNGAGGLRIAAGATSLDLAGRLGQTPIRISGGPVGFAWPGAMAAKSVDIALGPADTASRFRLSNLTATLGKEIGGSFDGTDVQLFAVPLDIVGAQGQWRYAGQKLAIEGANFTLNDRRSPGRFNPLVSRDGALTLFANRIDATASLQEPTSGRQVVRTVIRHDLATGDGHADLLVDSLTFDKALQPDRITPLALGVAANVAGTVRGKGVVDWTPRGVTSSGAFSSDSLDLAAAFGPVRGLSGTLRFSDLLGMVTEPHQVLHVMSVNPGIEVADGTVDIALLPNSLLRLNGARWPFMGGTLEMKPVDLNLGLSETRRYVLVITGLDAARFVQHMDLQNISATGIFDGELPLVFDDYGGRIEGGMLTGRPPGGNVSYVGALTYKDLSAMANFAFDALKSLDYTHMTIGMDGALDGEIVTRVRLDGVKQGAGAKRNFATRAVAGLPIQFNINIRAPFHRLITTVKAMYDPAYIENPVDIGIIDKEGRPVGGTQNGVRDTGQPVIVLPTPSPTPAPSGSVQPPASGTMR